ncbi:unnamed protein product [Brassica oleracea]
MKWLHPLILSNSTLSAIARPTETNTRFLCKSIADDSSSPGEETQNTHNDDDEEVDVTTTQSSTARESSISRFRRSSTVEMCGKVYKLAPVTLAEREQSVHQEKKMDPRQSSFCDYS